MNLKNQLADTGIAAHLTLSETGEQLTMHFQKGEEAKRIHLSVAGFDIEGKIGWVPVDAPDGMPNLMLHLVAPAEYAYKVLIPDGTIGDKEAERLHERLDSMDLVLADSKAQIIAKDGEIEMLKRQVEANAGKDARIAELQERVNQLDAEVAGLTAPTQAASTDIPVETPSSHEEPVTTSGGKKRK